MVAVEAAVSTEAVVAAAFMAAAFAEVAPASLAEAAHRRRSDRAALRGLFVLGAGILRLVSAPKYERSARPYAFEGMAVARATGAVRRAQLFRGHRLPHRKTIPDKPWCGIERLRARRRWPAASGLVLRT